MRYRVRVIGWVSSGKGEAGVGRGWWGQGFAAVNFLGVKSTHLLSFSYLNVKSFQLFILTLPPGRFRSLLSNYPLLLALRPPLFALVLRSFSGGVLEVGAGGGKRSGVREGGGWCRRGGREAKPEMERRETGRRRRRRSGSWRNEGKRRESEDGDDEDEEEDEEEEEGGNEAVGKEAFDWGRAWRCRVDGFDAKSISSSRSVRKFGDDPPYTHTPTASLHSPPPRHCSSPTHRPSLVSPQANGLSLFSKGYNKTQGDNHRLTRYCCCCCCCCCCSSFMLGVCGE